MKNRIYSIVLSLGLITLIGCNDFLKQDPPLYVTEDGIYSDSKRVESALRGLYGFLKQSYHLELGNSSFVGGKAYLSVDIRGEDVVNVSANSVDMTEVYTMAVVDIDPHNSDFWTNAYQVVNKANLFLAGIETSKDNEVIDLAKYEQYKSEALFIRALAFFYLNNTYGKPYSQAPDSKSILLRLSGEKGMGNNSFPQSTVAEVYDRILTDLSDENISKMMVRKSGGTADEIYTQVTQATQAAAYMLKMRVYLAMNKWTEAIACGEAVKGYDLSKDITSLFKTPYHTEETIFSLPMANNNVPNTQLSLVEYYNGTSKVLLVDTETGIASKPNYSLADDARVSKLIDKEDRLSKFPDRAKLDWVPVFRFAEVKLNLAEAYISSSAPNPAKAKALLKEVRVRSIAADKDPLKIDALSNDELKQAIYDEKRLEFLGEGIRSFDITRRLETVQKGKDQNGKPTIVSKPGDASYIWPIPLTEKHLNDAIE